MSGKTGYFVEAASKNSSALSSQRTITDQNESSLCQALGRGLLLRRGLWPVLARVKVGPARARGGADQGGAPPGRWLRSGWFGAYQEQVRI
jgi:hypothetical protein